MGFSKGDVDAALKMMLDADIVSLTVNGDGEFLVFMTDEQREAAEELWRDE